MKGIGNKIRRLREIKGISQKVIAEGLGNSVSNYSKIENDQISVTLAKLEKIAMLLGTTYIELINFDERNVKFESISKSITEMPSNEEQFKLYVERLEFLEHKVQFMENKMKNDKVRRTSKI